MKQEIFYKELEKLDKIEMLSRENLLSKDKTKIREYIKNVSSKLYRHEASDEEIKIFVSAIYLLGMATFRDNGVYISTIPNNVENYEEFTMALIFKGFRDGFGKPNSSIINDLNIDFGKTEYHLDRFIQLIRKEDLPLIKDNLFIYLGKYEEIFKAKYFPDHKLDLERINLLYSSVDLKRLSSLLDIDYERIELFRGIICIPYDVIGYHRSYFAAVTMLFRLTKVTKPLTDDEYDILAALLNHHSLKEYSYSIAYSKVEKDVEEEFRKLCKAYIKLINTKSKSVIVNRVDKILFTEFNAERKARNSFGIILKEELLQYDGSKMLTKVIVEKSL